MATPYMNLDLPVVGPAGTLGPEWADLLNAALTMIDEHDHSDGKGKTITPAGLNINQTLDMNDNQLASLALIVFSNISGSLVGSNLLYEADDELYFNDGAGNVVQLTSGGSINVASLGTITGDYSTSSADLTYSDASKTYIFKQNATTTANVDMGPIKIYRNSPGSPYALIQQNAAQAGNLDWTLPVAYPGSTLPLKSSSAGVLTVAQILTAEIADSQVTTAKIADSNVTTAKIADSNVTTAKIADSNVTTAKIADGAITPAKKQTLNAVASLGSSTFSTTSTTPVDVTNLSITITCNGRPIVVMMKPRNLSVGGFINISSSSASGIGTMYLLKDSIEITRSRISTFLNPSAPAISMPCSVFQYIDFDSTLGSRTYKMQASVNAGTSTFGFDDCELVAYEL